MKKISQILIILLSAVSTVTLGASAPMLDWQKCYGGTAQDIPGNIIKSHDGSLIILGNVESVNGDISSNHGSTDIWLSKTDSSGNIVWKKSFGGTSIDVGTSVVELPNGNFIIAGYSSSSNGDIQHNISNFDVILIGTDSNGNLLWENNYGGSQVDLCYSMILANDGNLVLGGASFSDDGDVSANRGGQDFWFLKTDVNGNVLWELNAGGSGTDICYAVAQDANGNIYAAGTTNSIDGDINNTHGNYDVSIAKISNNGSFIWIKTYGGTLYETAQCLLIDSQQRIIAGGYTRSDDGNITANAGFGDCWLIQVNAQGTLMFQKTFGGTGAENLYSIIQTSDGGYLLASGTTSDDFDIHNTCGFEDVWLLKLNNQFGYEWTKNYGGSGSDRPVRLLNISGSEFLVAAYTFSSDNDVHGQHGSADIWILNFACKSPVASFVTSSSTCVGDTLHIQNTSAQSSAYTWLVNNSYYSSSASIDIPLLITGNYHIQLIASTCGLTSNSTTDLSITNCGLPTVNIQASSNHICVNSEVSFSDSSSNTISWQWTFPGGNPSTSTSPSPTVTYSQPGTYSVMLMATNAYGNQSLMRMNYISVYALPTAPVVSVNGNILTSSFAANYQWLFNGVPVTGSFATGQQFTATNEGYYSVMVINSNGCESTSQPVFFSLMDIAEKSATEFKAYPNPTSGPFEILFAGNVSGKVVLYDLLGNLLVEKKLEGINSVKLSLTDYPAGTYTVLFTDRENKTKHISIMNY